MIHKTEHVIEVDGIDVDITVEWDRTVHASDMEYGNSRIWHQETTFIIECAYSDDFFYDFSKLPSDSFGDACRSHYENDLIRPEL